MAKTQHVYLKGKCKWARLVQPDIKYNVWSLVLYPDSESYSKLMELRERHGDTDGILNVIKKDDEGYNITLKRPVEKTYSGQRRGLNPPEVVEADGTTPCRNASAIGNGSDVTCKLEYYTYKKPVGGRGSAIRLASVRVDNLVPYNADEDRTEDQKKLVAGMSSQPAPSF